MRFDRSSQRRGVFVLTEESRFCFPIANGEFFSRWTQGANVIRFRIMVARTLIDIVAIPRIFRNRDLQIGAAPVPDPIRKLHETRETIGACWITSGVSLIQV